MQVIRAGTPLPHTSGKTADQSVTSCCYREKSLLWAPAPQAEKCDLKKKGEKQGLVPFHF